MTVRGISVEHVRDRDAGGDDRVEPDPERERVVADPTVAASASVAGR
jgi:hypothetical protein